MATVTLQIPDDIQMKLNGDRGDIGAALRLAAAFSLCQRGQLSTSQAARLAGLTYADFLDAAAQANIELFPVNLDELKEEASRGFTLGRQRVANYLPGEGRSP
jgi:Uncharacterized small protein